MLELRGGRLGRLCNPDGDFGGPPEPDAELELELEPTADESLSLSSSSSLLLLSDDSSELYCPCFFFQHVRHPIMLSPSIRSTAVNARSASTSVSPSLASDDLDVSANNAFRYAFFADLRERERGAKVVFFGVALESSSARAKSALRGDRGSGLRPAAGLTDREREPLVGVLADSSVAAVATGACFGDEEREDGREDGRDSESDVLRLSSLGGVNSVLVRADSVCGVAGRLDWAVAGAGAGDGDGDGDCTCTCVWVCAGDVCCSGLFVQRKKRPIPPLMLLLLLLGSAPPGKPGVGIYAG